MLRGRQTEQAAIDTLLRNARDGHGAGMVVRGEPGVGKSALMAYAHQAAAGMHVLRTVGVEPERMLGYAALHRLLLPMLDQVDRLPMPQARALRVVFGRDEGAVPDRFMVALAAMNLLSELAEDRPVVCLVDDVQWADRETIDVLGFAARRLDGEPIAVILATRAEQDLRGADAGLDDLPVAGLAAEAATELLRDHCGDRLSPDEQSALLGASAGNPLAIREFAALALAGHPVRRGEPLPLTERLHQAFLEQAGRHGAATRQVLLLIAAEGAGRKGVLHRAAAILGIETALLDHPDLDGLLVSDGAGVAFRHPLIRSAIYHGASLAERRAVHHALATALEEDPAELDRAAWHLAHAADGPDERVAAALERSAMQPLRSARPVAMATALERAAELSPSGLSRHRRWVAAASGHLGAGDSERATLLLNLAEATEPGAQPLRRDIAELRALIELRTGSPAEAVALLRSALADTAAAEDDRERALGLLMLYGEAAIMAGVPGEWAAVATRGEFLNEQASEPMRAVLRIVGSTARDLLAVDRPADTVEAPTEADLLDLERLTEPDTLVRVAGMVWGAGHVNLARRLRSRAVRLARTRGMAGSLAWVLVSLVTDNLAGGHLAVAEADAEEGLRLAQETGQPNTACRFRSLLALLAAHRGRETQAGELAEGALVEAEARDLPDVRAWSRHALGMLELLAGRSADALEHLQAMSSPTTFSGIFLGATPDFVEAAVRAGEPERAVGPSATFSRWAARTNAPELLALAARCRALLATDDSVTGEFEVALKLHAVAPQPMDQARTQLLAGEQLRRSRKRTAARQHLRAAAQTFARLGATPWAERARAEARAAGESIPHQAANALAMLTPQELRIAMAVSEGASNRQIAARYFLSPRTIDYHLRKIFHKTGTASRVDLARLVLGDHETGR